MRSITSNKFLTIQIRKPKPMITKMIINQIFRVAYLTAKACIIAYISVYPSELIPETYVSVFEFVEASTKLPFSELQTVNSKDDLITIYHVTQFDGNTAYSPHPLKTFTNGNTRFLEIPLEPPRYSANTIKRISTTYTAQPTCNK